MNQKKLLTIKEFSQLTGIKSDTLRFYDRIGLLCPDIRGDNNYRYYSRRQLDSAYLILSLRGIGVGIEDIKQYAACPTTENSLALLAQQDTRIQNEIRRLQEMSLIMQMYADMMHEAVSHGENALFIQKKAREPIFLCPPVPAHMDDDEGMLFSYEYAEDRGINLGFPGGTLIDRAFLTLKNQVPVDRYYFKTIQKSNAYKPEGNYAVAYGRCDIWEPEPIYRQLAEFVKDQDLTISGYVYEEYPFGAIAEQNTDQCLIRLEVPVTFPASE